MDYIASFKSLRTDRKFSVESPHKAVLLLTVLDMYEKNILTSNEIVYNESLIQCFQDIWDRALPNESLFHPNAYLPYWHLQSEGFWHIVAVRGKEDVVDTYRKDHIKPSEAKIKECVKYAYLDEDLYFLMTIPSGRSSLKQALLEKYSKLSSKEIQEWIAPVDNTVDLSANAIEEFSSLVKSVDNSSRGWTIMENPDDSVLSELSDDVFITLHYYYFAYLKNHRFERTIFKEVIPTVADLYRSLINHGEDFNSLPASYSYAIEGFLKELRIAMMNEYDVDDLIEGIDASISVLCGIDHGRDSFNVSDEELFESIDENSEEDLGSDDETQTQKKSNVSVDSENIKDNEDEPAIEPYSPVDYFVENNSKKGFIYNLEGKEQLTVDGQLKVIRGKLYRFNYKPMCLTVKGLYKTVDGWEKGGKLLVPYSDSDLYRLIDKEDFLNYIEDFIETENFRNNKIKYNGVWYDFDGYEDREFVPKSIYSETPDKVTADGRVQSLVSYDCLKNLLDTDLNHYTSLWLWAIVSLLNENNSLAMTYDELACMMISCAWEAYCNNVDLKETDDIISECIDFIIEESQEYMDVSLSLESSKEDVFSAIKDYPMGGAFEDAVDELTSSSPVDLLRLWFNEDEMRNVAMHSVNYYHSCLYAIHKKDFESKIEINPAWENILHAYNSNLQTLLKKKFITR